jgi:hypothetical protein
VLNLGEVYQSQIPMTFSTVVLVVDMLDANIFSSGSSEVDTKTKPNTMKQIPS